MRAGAPRRARRRDERGEGGGALSAGRRRPRGGPRRRTGSQSPGPAGPSRIPRPGGAHAHGRSPRRFRAPRHRALGADDRSSCSTSDRVLRPAILWNDQRTACRVRRSNRGANRTGPVDRAHGETQRCTGVHGTEAPSGSADTSRTSTHSIAHALLPKDYIRLRLTGERATDVADASGHCSSTSPGGAGSDDVLDALEVAARMAARSVRVSAGRARRAGRGRPGRRCARCRHCRSGACLGCARHLGRRLRRAAIVQSRSGGARPCVLSRRPRCLARDGRDAQRGGCASLGFGESVLAPALRGAPGWRPPNGRRASRASSSSPTSPASARRTPIRSPGRGSSGSRCGTTPVR